MNSVNVLGLIFASIHDEYVSELTRHRTMGAIPFGGRYRLIDFTLSNFVNSGLSEVGVITKSNYSSLFDHLGSGRDWDLSRKKGGLHLLPPYYYSRQTGVEIYKGRLDALSNIWSYVENVNVKYVILSNCDILTTIDFIPVLKQHKETKADITLVYSKKFYDNVINRYAIILEFSADKTVNGVFVNPQISGEFNQWLEIMIINKEVLKKIVKDAVSKNVFSFITEILQAKKTQYKIMGYEHKCEFVRIDSINNFYKANLSLLEKEKRDVFFRKDFTIYTKVGDNAPVRYGLNACVKNSFIADGCIVDGNVEKCILFRGVKIGKNTAIKNSVIMQGTVIGDRCNISSIIADKNVEISDDKMLTGCSETYPIYISKNEKI